MELPRAFILFFLGLCWLWFHVDSMNVQDARYKMLELHGSEALAWTVKDVEKVADSTPGDAPMEQMMLDFREPVEPPKRKRRTVKRGIAG